MSYFRIFSICLLLVATTTRLGAQAAAEPSASESIAVISAQLDNSLSSLEVKVDPPAGTKLNYLGPWKLVLEPSGFSTKSGKNSFEKGDFDQKAQKFVVPVIPSKEGGGRAATKIGGNYTLTYFLCDIHEKWCVRKVAQGQILVAAK